MINANNLRETGGLAYTELMLEIAIGLWDRKIRFRFMDGSEKKDGTPYSGSYLYDFSL